MTIYIQGDVTFATFANDPLSGYSIRLTTHTIRMTGTQCFYLDPNLSEYTFMVYRETKQNQATLSLSQAESQSATQTVGAKVNANIEGIFSIAGASAGGEISGQTQSSSSSGTTIGNTVTWTVDWYTGNLCITSTLKTC